MKIQLELPGHRPDFYPSALRLAAAHLGALANPDEYEIVTDIAAQIEAQIPKPRIREPGLWAIVEAGVKPHDTRLKWVRLNGEWAPDDLGEYTREWEDLVDPVLIREGI